MDKYKIILYILVFFIFQMPAYAYIDPGTGSMLFSIVLCSLTSVFFLFNTLVLKLKGVFFAKKTLAKNKHKFVIYSEGNQYYSVFKPILDEFEKRKEKLTYYTSASDDYFFSENYEYIEREYIGKGNKAYFKLAFLNADVCLMTVPHLDVLQLKRSKNVKHYAHIFHSIGFSMDYRLFALDYYDSILCDASFQIPLIREIEQKRELPSKTLQVVGSTYLDFNKSKIKNNVNEKYTVLIAPSWGRFGLLNKFGNKILKQLANSSYQIIIRPHPQSLIVDKKMIDELIFEFKDTPNIEWDFESNNLNSLSRADVLISDFSSILMDYAFLFNKPFIYFDTDINFDTLDCGDLDVCPPWRYHAMEQIGVKLSGKEEDINNIISIIEDLKNNSDVLDNIEKARNYAWEHQGNAGKNVADFLIKTQLEIKE